MNSFCRISLVILLAGSMSITGGGCENEIIENDQILTFSVSPDGQYAVASVFNEDDPWNMEQKLYAINLADNSVAPRLLQQDDAFFIAAWRNTNKGPEVDICSNTSPNSIITRRTVLDGSWAGISTTTLIPPVCDVISMQWNPSGALLAMDIWNGKALVLALASDDVPYPQITSLPLSWTITAWADDSTLYWVNKEGLVKASVDSTEDPGKMEITVEGEDIRLFGCIEGKPVYAIEEDASFQLLIGGKLIATYENYPLAVVDGSYMAVSFEGVITVFDGSGQTIHTRDVGTKFVLLHAICAETKTVYLSNKGQAKIESFDFTTEGSEMLVVFDVE